MPFEEAALSKLISLLAQHGIKMEFYSGYDVSFQSHQLFISLLCDKRDQLNSLWVGSESNEIEIDDVVAHEYFQSNVSFNQKSTSSFLDNVFFFFSGPGKILLTDSSALAGLRRFNAARSQRYTHQLINKQKFVAASNAWENKHYAEVVRQLSDVKINDLPESLKEKYRIALKRLNGES